MESTMRTEPRISSNTFNWSISRFDLLCPMGCKNFDVITSERFTAGEDIGKKTKWFVKLGGSADHITCFLNLDVPTGETSDVRCSFAIYLGNDENKQIYPYGPFPWIEHNFTLAVKNWGYFKFISIDKLYQEKETLLRNNTLQVCVQMKIYGEHYTALNHKRNVDTLQVLSADFLEMFNNQAHSDVEIVCGTKTFYAHKSILSARSKVFSAMFTSKMVESSTSKVELADDIDADIFHAILLYIYTGKVEVNDLTSYYELVYRAEKYDLSELKQHCFDQLCKSVTDETIGMLAVAAEKYNAGKETVECIKEYCQRKIATLLKDPAFKNLVKSHPNAFF